MSSVFGKFIDFLLCFISNGPHGGGVAMTCPFFRFDPAKALQIILWVASRMPYPGFLQINKVVYFADKEHLQKYGRQLCGDNYVAMEDGPVPSAIYDMMKDVRYRRTGPYSKMAQEAFVVENGHLIRPISGADERYLSDSDKECLKHAIDELGNLDYGEISRRSHDSAWEKAWSGIEEEDRKSAPMGIDSIIRILPDGDKLIEHLEDITPCNSQE